MTAPSARLPGLITRGLPTLGLPNRGLPTRGGSLGIWKLGSDTQSGRGASALAALLARVLGVVAGLPGVDSDSAATPEATPLAALNLGGRGSG